VIGFVGDIHGDMNHLTTALRTFHRLGVRVIFQLGDFGFIWPGEPVRQRLDSISTMLTNQDQVLLWVDGNHEAFPMIPDYIVERTPPLDVDQRRPVIEWNAPRLGHLQRGWRTILSNGMTMGALGGAGSIDRSHRVEGENWWSAEQITETDLHALGSEPLDILIGHEAPFNLTATHADDADRPRRDWGYAQQNRVMYARAFNAVLPRLTFSGHWHLFTSELLIAKAALPPAAPFTTRAVILDRNTPGGYSLATLDLRTLLLRVFTPYGAELDNRSDWRSVPERDSDLQRRFTALYDFYLAGGPSRYELLNAFLGSDRQTVEAWIAARESTP
jgi:Calcineurin-like phosphoesterase